MKDTTKKVKTLSDLSMKDSEIRYRRLFEAAQVGILILDARTGMIQDVNPYLIKMLGYSRKGLLKKKLWEVGAFKDIEASQDAFEALQKNDYIRYEDLPLKAKDGRVIQVEFVSNVYQVGDEKVIQCDISDISQRAQAQEQIRSLAKFPEENPNPILRVRQDGVLLFANRTGWSLFPSFRKKTGRHVSTFWSGLVKETYASRDNKTVEIQLGGRAWSFFLVPILDNGYVNVYGSDITERKRADEALRESQELLEKTFASLLDAVFIIDSDTAEIIDCNPAASAIFGYSRQEMLSRTTAFLHVDPDALEEFRQHLTSDVEKKGFLFMPELRMRRKDGTVFPTEHSVVPLENEQGKRFGWVSIVHDITARKQAEEESREVEERFKAIASNTPDHILMQDRQLRYTFVANPQLGLTEQDMLGKSDYDFLSTADAEKITQIKTQVLESGEPMKVETSLLSLAGEIEYFDGTYTPKFDSGGQVEGLIGYFRNVTKRKQAEQELLKLNMAVDTSVEVIFMTDRQGVITFANPAFTRIYGYTADEVVGKTTPRILKSGLMKPKDYAAFWQTLLNRQVVEGELINKTKDGRLLSIENTANPILNQQKEIIGFLCIQRDITERKRTEEALINRESMLQKIFDILPVGLWIADKDGKLLRGNPAGVKIWGAEPKVSPSEYGVFKARRLPSRKEIAPDDWALAHTIRDRVTIVDELLEIDAFDGKEKTILNYTAPVLDDQGVVQGAIVVNQDITERKRAETELARSHDQMRALTLYWQAAIEAERAHISHEIHDEFGQSMTALKMDLAWLAARLPEGDEKMDRIRGMNTLVDSSITLMRRIATDLRPALLDDLGLNAALEWQAGQFSKHSGIPCKLNLPKDDLVLDPALNTTLFRIFQETLTNITRHAQAKHVNASLKQNLHSLVLTIRDNGRGISENELKDPHSLGLLGLRERAAQWGGETTLRGTAGKGTTVTVRIPLPASPVNGGR